jgi:hypothetical protein
MSAIPDAFETRQYLDLQSVKMEYTVEQLKSIEESKSKIRAILGIG